jgi:hypothetical protein
VYKRQGEVHNCVFYGNGGYGVGGADVHRQIVNCAFGSNTSGNVEGTVTYQVGDITLTADPFVDNAGDDYRPNNTAGGGALLRGASSPWLGDYQTTQGDVGALHHEDPAGGGGGMVVHPGTTGGINA